MTGAMIIPESPLTLVAGRRRRRSIRRRWIAILLFPAVFPGCAGGGRVVVPAALIDTTVVEDLETTFALYDVRGVAILAEPEAPSDASGSEEVTEVDGETFRFCDGGDLPCREIVFTRSGAARSVAEAVELLSRRDDVERVVLVLSRRWDDTLEAQRETEGVALPFLDDSVTVDDSQQRRPAIEVIVPDADEGEDSFARRVDRAVEEPDIGVVLLTGTETPAVFRRWGEATGTPPIVFETPFPGTGERFRQAGYPVVGTVTYDLSVLFDDVDHAIKEDASVYVPTALFRY